MSNRLHLLYHQTRDGKNESIIEAIHRAESKEKIPHPNNGVGKFLVISAALDQKKSAILVNKVSGM